MALRPEPTAPFQSVQYALRVLETVSKYGDGVTGARIARETGLLKPDTSPRCSSPCGARAMWRRSAAARTSSGPRS